jgi:hypothetical protein
MLILVPRRTWQEMKDHISHTNDEMGKVQETVEETCRRVDNLEKNVGELKQKGNYTYKLVWAIFGVVVLTFISLVITGAIKFLIGG